MIHGKYGRVLGMILAGGKGERLMPLTRYRAKPAVPFAAKYRIIDFALSNMVNSGLFSIYCLIQFKSQSLQQRLLHQRSAGPDVGRRALVRGHGRRDIPEHASRDALRRRPRVHLRGGPHLQDGRRTDARVSHGQQRRRNRRRVRRPLLRGEPVRMHRHRRDGTHHRFRRETRRSAGDSRTPRLQLRFDGQLHL